MNSATLMPSEGWKTLKLAIPNGAAKAVANRLHVSADHVRRWRREPLSDEAPLSSGQRSPLDRLCDLIDAVFLSKPACAAFIVEHVRNHHDALLEVLPAPDEWNQHEHAAATLREAAEAVNALNLDTVSDEETLVELIEARDLIDQAIVKIRSRRNSLEGPRDHHRRDAQESTRKKERSGSTLREAV